MTTTDPAELGFANVDFSDYAARVGEALARVPPSRWRSVVVLVRPEGVNVLTRRELVDLLDDSDLRKLGRAVERGRVPAGAIMVLISGDVLALKWFRPSPLMVVVAEGSEP